MSFAALQSELETRGRDGLLRQRHALQGPQSPHITVDGEPYLSFCSNDYLGFANHPRLVAALQQGAAQHGAGAGAAHLVSGHMQAHHELEQRLAAFVGKSAALLFSTGYMANLGVVQVLAGKGDTVFADKLNHASLNDAMFLSRAETRRYRHNDVVHLGKLLGQAQGGRRLVITDAVFSMDGDIALLPEILELCERHDAWLLVDDAHGFGMLGEKGRGTLSHFGLDSPRVIMMGTLGKAAGVFGAFVAAEQVVIDTLVNHAHSYVYTTAMPPALATAVQASLKLIAEADDSRAHLQLLIAHLRSSLHGLPWKLMTSSTAIQPLLIGDNTQALKLSEGLRERGIWVVAIRPPTVPQGTARLRITLSAAHTMADVDCLAETLHELAR
jgi:8-amino-7-oxononanoate synthase